MSTNDNKGQRMSDPYVPSTTQHTPGPWYPLPEYSNGGEVHSDWGRICDASLGIFESLEYRAAHRAESEANAHLIAAAPELLTDGELLAIAIQDFLENSDRSMAAAESVARRVATFRATAAKAKGEL